MKHLKITICLTNWKRPENLDRIIDILYAQSLSVEIFLWNNGEPYLNSKINWLVHSSLNKFCIPRWFMAMYAKTEYVCILDDDIIFNDNNLLRDAINILKVENESTIIGLTGVKLSEDGSYINGQHIYCYMAPNLSNIYVDIIKGSFMLMRTKPLIDTLAHARIKDDVSDDISMSYYMAKGSRKHHLCLASFGNRITSLGNDEVALWKNETHFMRRDNVCKELFIKNITT